MNIISDNLFGLILAGGHSRRMGQDKSLMAYHGKTQLDFAYELLSQFCPKVFISTRPDQRDQSGYTHLPQIIDHPEFYGQGPIGGILSAMSEHRQASWIVLASDLPFVTKDTIACLISNRNKESLATAFVSTHDQLPEPLCAIWESSGKSNAIKFLTEGVKCPRKILIKSDTYLIKQADPSWLDNVNNPEEYSQARGRILH